MHSNNVQKKVSASPDQTFLSPLWSRFTQEESTATTMEALKARIRELEKQIQRGDRYKCLICMVSMSYAPPLCVLTPGALCFSFGRQRVFIPCSPTQAEIHLLSTKPGWVCVFCLVAGVVVLCSCCVVLVFASCMALQVDGLVLEQKTLLNSFISPIH